MRQLPEPDPVVSVAPPARGRPHAVGAAQAPGRAPGRAPLAVIIPAWNEAANLDLLLPAVRETLAALAPAAELVVVDGGSRDRTAEVAAAHGVPLVPQWEPGYGGALLAGFAATSAPWVATMDADLSHRPDFLADLWGRRHEADVLIASRYVTGGTARMGRLRALASRTLNRVFAEVLSLPIRDLSSGYRLYHRRAVDTAALRARDFDALEEILVRAVNGGCRIVEAPFAYEPRRHGASHARVLPLARSFAATLGRMWRLRNSAAVPDYDWRAYDSPVWLQRYWQRARRRAVLGLLDRRDPVLDVGCGSSRIITGLPRAVGVDVALPKLRFMRPRHAALVQASGERLPFADAAFTAVICSQVVEHVPDDSPIWAELARVLAPGGMLVIGTPDYGRPLWWAIEWIYSRLLPAAYGAEHITHLTRRSLLKRLAATGYEVEALRYVGGCELIVRARKRHLRLAPAPRGTRRRSARG